MEIRGDMCHELLSCSARRELGYTGKRDYNSWRKQVKEKFDELLGINEIRRNACQIVPEIVKEEQKDGYKQIRFEFESERGAQVPCYLLIPDSKKDKKFPLVITLQGHSTGFHNSIGEPHDDADAEYGATRGKFAVQAVKHGYAALAIEQRAMGERISDRHPFDVRMCAFAALTAFQLGRTLVGERAWDVSKAIDALEILNYPQIDLDKIAITGSSGGGTASYYSGCFEERIKLVVPNCSVCSYETSTMAVYHCACNYIPNVCNYFEMGDFACLIAPRNLIISTGRRDRIFPIHGVQRTFDTVQSIYKDAGAKEVFQTANELQTLPFGNYARSTLLVRRYRLGSH